MRPGVSPGANQHICPLHNQRAAQPQQRESPRVFRRFEHPPPRSPAPEFHWKRELVELSDREGAADQVYIEIRWTLRHPAQSRQATGAVVMVIARLAGPVVRRRELGTAAAGRRRGRCNGLLSMGKAHQRPSLAAAHLRPRKGECQHQDAKRCHCHDLPTLTGSTAGTLQSYGRSRRRVSCSDPPRLRPGSHSPINTARTRPPRPRPSLQIPIGQPGRAQEDPCTPEPSFSDIPSIPC
jgi:hypothetical protein